MPRWFIVTLTWTLFAAVMLTIGWVLKQVVPPVSARLGQELGQVTSTIIVLSFIAISGALLLGLPRLATRKSHLPR